MSIALVTGASAGIGLSVVQKLAAQGHRLALVARTEQTLRAAAASLPAGAAEIFVCDVKDLAACAAPPGRGAARMGGLAGLGKNAGLPPPGPLLEGGPPALGGRGGGNPAPPLGL